MGASGNNLLQVIAKNFDVLTLPLVTLVYPLYASIKAIETKSIADDQQWLTYWVLYSLIALFELTFAKVLEVLPVWSYAKLIFSCWLVLPHFNGAAHVYKRYIRPFYMNPQLPQMPPLMPQMQRTSQMWYVPKKNIFSKQDDVLTAAERYMEENGTEAFERLISRELEIPYQERSDYPSQRIRSVRDTCNATPTNCASEGLHIVFIDLAPGLSL